MNEILLAYWHWFIAATVVFTLAGYLWLLFGDSRPRRDWSRSKETTG
ncbi:MAG: hypothetical protein ACLGI7_18815 [Gammaproteobacteria bacterium]